MMLNNVRQVSLSSLWLRAALLTEGKVSMAGGASCSFDSSDEPPPRHGDRTFASSSVDWDWAFVIGAKPGRKPAIKKPQRHQWLFCNPKYDANLPLPARFLPPHAPPSAAEADDWRLFNTAFGGKVNSKNRKEFVRYLKLRDVDWRNAFHRGLADHVADFKKAQRMKAEQLRQDAWRKYREGIFENVLPGLSIQKS